MMCATGAQDAIFQWHRHHLHQGSSMSHMRVGKLLVRAKAYTPQNISNYGECNICGKTERVPKWHMRQAYLLIPPGGTTPLPIVSHIQLQYKVGMWDTIEPMESSGSPRKARKKAKGYGDTIREGTIGRGHGIKVNTWFFFTVTLGFMKAFGQYSSSTPACCGRGLASSFLDGKFQNNLSPVPQKKEG